MHYCNYIKYSIKHSICTTVIISNTELYQIFYQTFHIHYCIKSLCELYQIFYQTFHMHYCIKSLFLTADVWSEPGWWHGGQQSVAVPHCCSLYSLQSAAMEPVHLYESRDLWMQIWYDNSIQIQFQIVYAYKKIST